MGGVPGPVSPSCGDPPALRATSCRRKTEGAGRMSHTRHNTKRRFLCVPQLGERAAGKLAVAGARSRGTYSLGGGGRGNNSRGLVPVEWESDRLLW